MTSPNVSAPNTAQPVSPSVTIAACLFAIFSFALLLPTMFGVGESFYLSAEIDLPVITEWFMAMTPWILIGFALAATAILWFVRWRGTPRASQSLGWSMIIVTAFLTLLGTLAFLMPMIAIMSGLQQ